MNISGLRAAFAFLTVLPVPAPRDWSPGATVPWYPVVGVAIGGILCGLAFALWEVWPPLVCAAMLCAAWAGLSGFLHLDGLADTADAALAPLPRARRIEILRDIHHGTFGVAAITITLLLRVAVLAEPARADTAALLLTAPVSGRACIVALMRLCPASHPGLGSAARAGASWRAICAATVCCIAVALVAFGWPGLAIVGAAMLAAGVAATMLTGRLGGLGGDSYGALIEIAELATLLAGSAMLVHDATPFPWRGAI
ncbi:MAG: adenosylcobinamide-GDP ribazoletransferase [Dehalococcoidia bacterium]